MGILPVCMSVYHVSAWCPQRPKEVVESPLGWCYETEPGSSGGAASASNC